MYFSPIPSLILPDSLILFPYTTSMSSKYFFGLLKREFIFSKVLSGVSKISVGEFKTIF
jgi:hypothetical protein